VTPSSVTSTARPISVGATIGSHPSSTATGSIGPRFELFVGFDVRPAIDDKMCMCGSRSVTVTVGAPSIVASSCTAVIAPIASKSLTRLSTQFSASSSSDSVGASPTFS
jgi:hypothetical protein